MRLFLIALVFVLSGCSCGGLRQSQVMVSQEHTIIDYNDCFEEYCLDPEANAFQAIKKQPLSPEMFDPFQPIDSEYRLAKGDILELSVFGEEESLVDNAMIAPDGNLYYAFLDGLPAEGRKPEELAKDIASKLDHLFLEPQVSVIPKKTEALTYRILGRVRSPGEFSFEGPVSLREAIGNAGGLFSQSKTGNGEYVRNLLVPYVNLEESFIVRDNKKLDIDFAALLIEGDSTQDIYLRPGDYVYIVSAETQEVFVLGSVLTPQRVTYVPGMTLMSALTKAGGWPTNSPYSPDLKRFMVIRGGLECPKACQVNLRKILTGKARDLYLQPGDIVYATHKKFRFARELVYLAVDAFVYSFVTSAGVHYAREHWFNGDEDEEDEEEE